MKMNPLVSNQWVLMWLCVCPASESASANKKVAYVAFTLLFCITILSTVAANVTFVIKFISIDLEKSLYAFVYIIAFSGIIYVMIVALLYRHKINAIFVELSAIYKASKFRPIPMNDCYHFKVLDAINLIVFFYGKN